LVWRLIRQPVIWVLDVRSPPTDQPGFLGDLQEIIYRTGLWLAGRIMHGWTTITPALKKQVADLGRISPNDITVWSSGVFTDDFNPEVCWQPPDWPADREFVFIYHGTLSNERALVELVEAFAVVDQEIPNAGLFFLGSGPDQEMLRERANQLQIANRVYFHAPVPHSQVPNYVNAADVGIVPAPDTEWYSVSSPLKLMEYLSLGKPIISTGIDAIQNILGGVGDVVIVPCNPGPRPSIVDLVAGMRRAWQLYGSQFYSTTNRDIAVQKLDWRVQARRLEQYLLMVRPNF